jgi:hypothetical protein
MHPKARDKAAQRGLTDLIYPKVTALSTTQTSCTGSQQNDRHD